MQREFSFKKRNSRKRKPKPLVLIVAEGRNVTETQYFQQFQKQHANFNIKVLSPGSKTDPQGMKKKLERYWKQNDMSPAKGDLGFIVLDLDCDDKKGNLIEKLKAHSEFVRFIVSNPCFEVWFLLHFKFTTHVYANGEEVIEDLRAFIADYEKTKDVAGTLADKTDVALDNAKQLVKAFDELGYKWPSNQCNPRTDVPEIINSIRAF